MLTNRFVSSVVAVPVPEARALTSGWRGPQSLDAHVTLVAPFLDPREIDGDVVTRLAACLADVRIVDVVFNAVGWFDRRVVFIAPDDPSPFRRLSTAIAIAFDPDVPERDPSTVVPHLTVAKNRPFNELVVAAAASAECLPLSGRASEVVLYLFELETHSWRVHTRVPLATAPT